MDSKIFEIRAEGTLMVVLATQVSASNEAERYLLGRSGFGNCNIDCKKYIIVQHIDGGEGYATTDPYIYKAKL
jgi:hypothetical protein